MFNYRARKTTFIQQRSEPGQDTDVLAITCSKFCTSKTLKEDYGIENIDQLPGVQFLQNLGQTQEQVVLLQSGEKKMALKKFLEAPTKMIITLYSYFLLLNFFTSEEWTNMETAAKEHQQKKSVVLEGGAILMGENIAAYADKVLQDMGGNVFLMLRVKITDQIFFTLKFVDNSCEWIKEHGSVTFDLPTIKKFVNSKFSLDTFFNGTNQMIFGTQQTVAATPSTSQTPSVAATPSTSQTPSAPQTKEGGEMIQFDDDSNFVGNFEIQSLLQDFIFNPDILSQPAPPPPPPSPAFVPLLPTVPLPPPPTMPPTVPYFTITPLPEAKGEKRKESSKNKENPPKKHRSIKPKIHVPVPSSRPPLFPKQTNASAAAVSTAKLLLSRQKDAYHFKIKN